MSPHKNWRRKTRRRKARGEGKGNPDNVRKQPLRIKKNRKQLERARRKSDIADGCQGKKRYDLEDAKEAAINLLRYNAPKYSATSVYLCGTHYHVSSQVRDPPSPNVVAIFDLEILDGAGE